MEPSGLRADAVQAERTRVRDRIHGVRYARELPASLLGAVTSQPGRSRAREKLAWAVHCTLHTAHCTSGCCCCYPTHRRGGCRCRCNAGACERCDICGVSLSLIASGRDCLYVYTSIRFALPSMQFNVPRHELRRADSRLASVFADDSMSTRSLACSTSSTIVSMKIS